MSTMWSSYIQSSYSHIATQVDDGEWGKSLLLPDDGLCRLLRFSTNGRRTCRTDPLLENSSPDYGCPTLDTAAAVLHAGVIFILVKVFVGNGMTWIDDALFVQEENQFSFT